MNKNIITKYDMIYSLGVNCACAEYLRKLHLRNKSGPLDWIVSGDVYAPFKTLLDEFKIFMDFSYLSPDICDDSALNIRCLHTKNQYLLLHDFFKDKPVSEQEENVKQKYLRRIKRLLSDLNSSKNILLCWYGENGALPDMKQIIDYVNKIRAKYKANINFLFILYNGPSSMQNKEILPGVAVYVLPKARLAFRQEGHLLWDRENIENIFSRIKLQNNNKPLFLAIRNTFYRVLAACIFNRIKRHRFLEDKLRNN